MLFRSDPAAAIKLRALDVQMAKIQAQTKDDELAAQTARTEAVATVAVAEQVHGDKFVKHTRPLLARLAFFAGTGYTLLAWAAHTAAPLFGLPPVPGPMVPVLTMLYTPLLAYMGVRTVDGFSKGGRTR